MKEFQKTKSISPILVFMIGLFTLIPNTTSGQFVRMVILIVGFLVDIFLHKNNKVDVEVVRILALMLGGVLFSVITVLVFERQLNQSLVIHEVIRLSMNAMIIILVYKRPIKFSHLFAACVINVISIFTVQLFQSVAPADTNLIIRRYYTNPEALAHHLNLALETNRGFFRVGAFLINPNICACAVTLCCPYFYMGLKKEGYKRVSFAMLIISFLSIVLSGSRTGLIVFIVIGSIYLFDHEMSNRKKITIIGIMVVLGAFVTVLMSQGFSLSSFRSFDLVGALHQSLFEKMGIFFDYLGQANPIYWFTGSLGGRSSLFQLDAEWGYILSYFGAFGLLWYTRILTNIRKTHANSFAFFHRQYQSMVALMAFTESVFMCMPVAPLLILLSLSTLDKK